MRNKLLLVATLFFPTLAFASSTTDVISQIAGLFYIIVGLTVVAAFLLMIGGGVLWATRLGTADTYRDEAIKVMEWAIATLFTLVVVLGIVEFIQSHTQTTLYIIGIVILLLVVWLVVASGALSGSSEKEE